MEIPIAASTSWPLTDSLFHYGKHHDEHDHLHPHITPHPSATAIIPLRIGIVGYGKLGQYIVEQLLTDGIRYRLDLAFIWNRTALTEDVRSRILIHCPLVKFLEALEQIKDINVDLIVEVCHPDIVRQYAFLFLDQADFLLGSTAALADSAFAEKLNEKLAASPQHRMFVARGALWGADDIQMMARRDRLQSVTISMHFHPRALHNLTDAKLREQNEQLLSGDPRSIILYDGPARELCQMAPNNTNTIATAALLGVGFDHTIGRLVSDSSLCDYHQIEIEIRGKQTIDGKNFEVKLERRSPITQAHNISSLQTYGSFWHSILRCTGTFSRIQNLEIQIC